MFLACYAHWGIRSVYSLVEPAQPVADTGLLVVENMAVDALLGTAFINTNVESYFRRRQEKQPIYLGLVALKSTDLRSVSVTRTVNYQGKPVRYGAWMMTVIKRDIAGSGTITSSSTCITAKGEDSAFHAIGTGRSSKSSMGYSCSSFTTLAVNFLKEGSGRFGKRYCRVLYYVFKHRLAYVK